MMGIMATAVFCFITFAVEQLRRRHQGARVLASDRGCGKFNVEAEGQDVRHAVPQVGEQQLHVNMSKPENEIVQIDMNSYQDYTYKWEPHCLQITLEYPDALRLMVWSI